MTCIVGVEYKGAAIIGGDSCVSNHQEAAVIDEPKVFSITRSYDNEEILFGVSGSIRLLQAIKFSFRPPACTSQSDHAYIVTSFMSSLRSLVKDIGGMAVKDSIERSEVVALVGYRGRIYNVECDLQASLYTRGYTAIGSGGSVALGSLHATALQQDKGTEKDVARTRVERALQAAVDLTPFVRGPFVFKVTSHKK